MSNPWREISEAELVKDVTVMVEEGKILPAEANSSLRQMFPELSIAVEELEQVYPELSDRRAAELYRSGIKYFKAGRSDLAQNCFVEVLKEHENHPLAHVNLGVIYETRGEQSYKLAEYHYREGIQKAKAMLSGELRRDIEQTIEPVGKDALQVALAMGCFNLAAFLRERGRVSEGLTWVDEAIGATGSDHPGSLYAYYLLRAACLLDLEIPGEAKEWLKGAAELDTARWVATAEHRRLCYPKLVGLLGEVDRELGGSSPPRP